MFCFLYVSFIKEYMNSRNFNNVLTCNFHFYRQHISRAHGQEKRSEKDRKSFPKTQCCYGGKFVCNLIIVFPILFPSHTINIKQASYIVPMLPTRVLRNLITWHVLLLYLILSLQALGDYTYLSDWIKEQVEIDIKNPAERPEELER